MRSSRLAQHIITPCRSKTRLMQSLEEFGFEFSQSLGQHNFELEQRATQRQQAVQVRRQANIEKIISVALEHINKISSITQPDPDWLEHFLELAERTSHPRMQELWARVLIIESQQPSSFSVRALRLLAQLTPYEATLLRKAKAFTWFESKTKRNKIILGYQQRANIFRGSISQRVDQVNLASCGLNYPDILTLIDLGILHADLIESGLLPIQKGVPYYLAGQKVVLTPLEKDLILTYFRYTPIGEELCRLISVGLNLKYWEEFEQKFSHKFLLYKES